MISPRFGILPLLHDPLLNERVLIETLDGWEVLGADRRAAGYAGFFLRNETPLQLLRKIDGPGGQPALLSILTPCRATEGRFEFVMGEGPPVRKCCYRCVARELRLHTGVSVPNPMDWIAYMLLESHAYLNGKAPKERPYV